MLPRAALSLLWMVCLSPCSCLPPGQMLLSLEVSHRGEVVLSTVFDAPDYSTVAQLWDEAGERPFTTKLATSTLQASPSDPLTAALSGPVEVRIIWCDDVQSVVQLDGVTLVRSERGRDDWRLPAPEIQRAKRAAGL